VEREVRGRRGREQAGYRLGEGREWFECDLGLRVYAAVVEKRRVQGVQELGLVAGQRRGRGVRVRLRRWGWRTVAEATRKEEAAGGGEMAPGLEEESHGAAGGRWRRGWTIEGDQELWAGDVVGFGFRMRRVGLRFDGNLRNEALDLIRPIFRDEDTRCWGIKKRKHSGGVTGSDELDLITRTERAV
jgi:hypothetical protein